MEDHSAVSVELLDAVPQSIGRWGRPLEPREDPVQLLSAGKTHLLSDLRDRQIGFDQQLSDPIDTFAEDL